MIHELKRQAEGHTSRHNNERDERERHEVFPLEYQDMVDAKTGEGPTNPHQNQITASVLPMNQTKPGM